MRSILFTFLLIGAGIQMQYAQSFSGILSNHEPGTPEMEIVLMPYGMDHPVKVGTLADDGTLKMEIPGNDISHISEEMQGWYLGRLGDVLHFNCGDHRDFPVDENIKAAKDSYFKLWSDDQWVGTLFPVSDEKLLPWIVDNAYENPVKASFYEMIYVGEAVTVVTSCKNTWYLTDSQPEVAYDYDLHLKKGYNLIEYQIQDIYETDPNETSSKPSKVLTKVVDDYSKIIWIAKLYY